MAYRGAQYFDLGLLFESPNSSLNQAASGGFKDPLIGTAILLVISTLIAAPLGVTIAVWLTEYGRPAGLARRSNRRSRSSPARPASCWRCSA